MENPTSPQKYPYKVKVEKGKTYFWCSCGLSAKQPFCDGSHKKEGKFKSINDFLNNETGTATGAAGVKLAIPETPDNASNPPATFLNGSFSFIA